MNSVYDDLENKMLLQELKSNINTGAYTTPNVDIKEINSYMKQEYDKYKDVIKGNEFLESHLKGRDVGGEVSDNVIEELDSAIEKIEDKIIKTKTDYTKELIQSEDMYYDKESVVGKADINDNYSLDQLMTVQEGISRICQERFGSEPVRLTMSNNNDFESLAKLDQGDPADFEIAISINTKELKKHGVTVDDIKRDVLDRVDDEVFANFSVGGDREFKKIPEHRLPIGGSSIPFTEDEWKKVNVDFKNDIKKDLGLPTTIEKSSKALSMKL